MNVLFVVASFGRVSARFSYSVTQPDYSSDKKYGIRVSFHPCEHVKTGSRQYADFGTSLYRTMNGLPF